MAAGTVMFNIRDNETVRIDGRAYVAGGATDGGRRFAERETGNTVVLTSQALMRMAREGRITSEAMHASLSDVVREALARDWDSFSEPQRFVATRRLKMIEELEKSRPDRWHKKAELQKAIDAIEPEVEPTAAWSDNALRDAAGGEGTEAGTGTGTTRRTTTRSLRRWHLNYNAAGRDIRALIDMSSERGSREGRMPDWAIEEIDKAIHEVHATANRGSLAATRKRAVTRLRDRMARDGLAMPDFGQKDILGKNAIRRRLEHWGAYDVLSRQVGKAEADRIMTSVGIGPQGERPMSEVEVDHTLLDVLVLGRENGQIYGRPWLTTFLDRYSRCIVGFALTFHPPSWTSLMGALRNAVEDKSRMLAELGNIHCSWDCMGVPEELYSDNGKDFHSTSMRETQAVLSMKIVYVPRRSGWLKGKIERWYGSLEQQLIHLLPGTTFSNPLERKHSDPAKMAVLTLRQLNWFVTKWIVDVYHQTEHTGIGLERPAERWDRGIREHGPKLPPPAGLIKPLTGLVINGKLSRSGVRYKELRWNSNAFSGLLNRITNPDVQIRIDTQDLTEAYVYDEGRKTWIGGRLQNTDVEDGLTLHQYVVIRQHAKNIRLPDETKAAALSRAHGEIFDRIAEIKKGARKADKRFARFVEDGRKPSEHIAPSIHDPVESRNALGSHDLDGRRPRIPAPPTPRRQDQVHPSDPTARPPASGTMPATTDAHPAPAGRGAVAPTPERTVGASPLKVRIRQVKH